MTDTTARVARVLRHPDATRSVVLDYVDRFGLGISSIETASWLMEDDVSHIVEREVKDMTRLQYAQLFQGY